LRFAPQTHLSRNDGICVDNDENVKVVHFTSQISAVMTKKLIKKTKFSA